MNQNLYFFDSLNLISPNSKYTYAAKVEMLYVNNPDHISNNTSR